LTITEGLTRGADAEPFVDEHGDLAARLILALRAKPAVARRLSQVDVTNPHNAAVIVNDDRALIYVGEDRFLARLESYFGLAAALRERVAEIDYVDLRFEDRIYVRPARSAAKARTTAAEAARGRVLPSSSRKR